MAYNPTYKSQVYVPIQKDNRTFEDRQRSIWDEIHNDLDRDFINRDVSVTTNRAANPGGGGPGRTMVVGAGPMGSGGIWDDMHSRMEKRRKDWEAEVENMRKDFFRLTPSSGASGVGNGGAESIISQSSNGGSLMAGKPQEVYLEDSAGDKKFRVSFDVSQFSPNEISVRTQENKLIVHAKHEETGEGKNVSREFSRQIDIPKHVDPERLQSTLSKDGILQVEAPVAAPSYDKVTADSAAPVHAVGAPLHMQHMPSLQTSGLTGSGAGSPSGFKTGPVLTEQDGTRRLKMTVEIGREFRPEEVMVKTVDKKLQISAKHEEQVQGRTTMREFSKELELPENVDPNAVTASMSEDGNLIIEAPMSGYTQGSYQGKPGSTKQPEVSVSFK